MTKAEWWCGGQLFLTGLWSPYILVACLQVASLPGVESSSWRDDLLPFNTSVFFKTKILIMLASQW